MFYAITPSKWRGWCQPLNMVAQCVILFLSFGALVCDILIRFEAIGVR